MTRLDAMSSDSTTLGLAVTGAIGLVASICGLAVLMGLT